MINENIMNLIKQIEINEQVEYADKEKEFARNLKMLSGLVPEGGAICAEIDPSLKDNGAGIASAIAHKIEFERNVS